MPADRDPAPSLDRQKPELRPTWLWRLPGDGNEKARLENVPARIVLSDPAGLHSVDLSGFGVELSLPELRWSE